MKLGFHSGISRSHGTIKQKEGMHRSAQAQGKWKGIAWQLQAAIKGKKIWIKVCKRGKHNWTERNFSQQYHGIVELNKNINSISKKVKRWNDKTWERWKGDYRF